LSGSVRVLRGSAGKLFVGLAIAGQEGLGVTRCGGNALRDVEIQRPRDPDLAPFLGGKLT